MKKDSGFTFIEALLSLVLLAIVAIGGSSLYIGGFNTMDVRDDRMLLDSHLRSRMEVLISTDFSSLSSGSEAVTINGEAYTIQWSVTYTDLDGDSADEVNAKLVKVTPAGMPDHFLTTIVIDHEGKVGKL